ncbi:MAG: hypothetical protein ACOH5I_26095 [Oligoflexus sp.]
MFKKVTFLIALCFASNNLLAGGMTSGSGGVATNTIQPFFVSEESMLTLERNLSEMDRIKVKEIKPQVRAIQDFYTSKGIKGIVAEDENGLPIVILQNDSFRE